MLAKELPGLQAMLQLNSSMLAKSRFFSCFLKLETHRASFKMSAEGRLPSQACLHSALEGL